MGDLADVGVLYGLPAAACGVCCEGIHRAGFRSPSQFESVSRASRSFELLGDMVSAV